MTAVEDLWLVLAIVGVIAVVALGALGEVGLTGAYARIWGRLAERRAKR